MSKEDTVSKGKWIGEVIVNPYGLRGAPGAVMALIAISSPLRAFENMIMSMAYSGTLYDWDIQDKRHNELASKTDEATAAVVKAVREALDSENKLAAHDDIHENNYSTKTEEDSADDDIKEGEKSQEAEEARTDPSVEKFTKQIRSMLSNENGIELFKDFLEKAKHKHEIEIDDIKSFGVIAFDSRQKESLINIFEVERQKLKECEINPGDKPNLGDKKFGLVATMVTAIPQGAATYAAVYGLGLIFSTYVEGISGTISHAVSAAVIGLWFRQGRGVPAIIDGLAVGMTAYAIQAWGIPALATVIQNVCPLSDLHLQLLGGAATILVAGIFGSIALATTRTLDGDHYTCEKWENVFPIHHAVLHGIQEKFCTTKAQAV